MKINDGTAKLNVNLGSLLRTLYIWVVEGRGGEEWGWGGRGVILLQVEVLTLEL